MRFFEIVVVAIVVLNMPVFRAVNVSTLTVETHQPDLLVALPTSVFLLLDWSTNCLQRLDLHFDWLTFYLFLVYRGGWCNTGNLTERVYLRMLLLTVAL